MRKKDWHYFLKSDSRLNRQNNIWQHKDRRQNRTENQSLAHASCDVVGNAGDDAGMWANSKCAVYALESWRTKV